MGFLEKMGFGLAMSAYGACKKEEKESKRMQKLKQELYD